MTDFTNTKPQILANSNVSQFMNRVYGWMALGLLLCAASSYYVASSPALIGAIVTNHILFFGLIAAQIGAVFALSFFQARLSAAAIRVIFLGYTLLTGITLSTIFILYTSESIVSTFMITAAAFAGLSMYGFVTKRDLGPVGTFCMMGLWGMIIVMLAAIFIPSLRGDTMQLMIAFVGLIVFSGLTAYDTQKIKHMYLMNSFGYSAASKLAVFGALTLFLDFINLFLSLLRLMGDRR